MKSLPACPNCGSEFTYEDQNLLICPECAHEWLPQENESATITCDSVGNQLQNGDTVTLIKDLKVRGTSKIIKVGTKVKNIRLIDRGENDDHDIDCKISGFGAIRLRSEKVKKA